MFAQECDKLERRISSEMVTFREISEEEEIQHTNNTRCLMYLQQFVMDENGQTQMIPIDIYNQIIEYLGLFEIQFQKSSVVRFKESYDLPLQLDHETSLVLHNLFFDYSDAIVRQNTLITSSSSLNDFPTDILNMISEYVIEMCWNPEYIPLWVFEDDFQTSKLLQLPVSVSKKGIKNQIQYPPHTIVTDDDGNQLELDYENKRIEALNHFTFRLGSFGFSHGYHIFCLTFEIKRRNVVPFGFVNCGYQPNKVINQENKSGRCNLFMIADDKTVYVNGNLVCSHLTSSSSSSSSSSPDIRLILHLDCDAKQVHLECLRNTWHSFTFHELGLNQAPYTLFLNSFRDIRHDVVHHIPPMEYFTRDDQKMEYPDIFGIDEVDNGESKEINDFDSVSLEEKQLMMTEEILSFGTAGIISMIIQTSVSQEVWCDYEEIQVIVPIIMEYNRSKSLSPVIQQLREHWMTQLQHADYKRCLANLHDFLMYDYQDEVDLSQRIPIHIYNLIVEYLNQDKIKVKHPITTTTLRKNPNIHLQWNEMKVTLHHSLIDYTEALNRQKNQLVTRSSIVHDLPKEIIGMITAYLVEMRWNTQYIPLYVLNEEFQSQELVLHDLLFSPDRIEMKEEDRPMGDWDTIFKLGTFGFVTGYHVFNFQFEIKGDLRIGFVDSGYQPNFHQLSSLRFNLFVINNDKTISLGPNCGFIKTCEHLQTSSSSSSSLTSSPSNNIQIKLHLDCDSEHVHLECSKDTFHSYSFTELGLAQPPCTLFFLSQHHVEHDMNHFIPQPEQRHICLDDLSQPRFKQDDQTIRELMNDEQ